MERTVTDAQEIRDALLAEQAAAQRAADALKEAQAAAAAMETTRPPFWAAEDK